MPDARLPFLMKKWITAHPYQTAIHAVNGIVIYKPDVAKVPILAGLGFTSVGPDSGSAASSLMSQYKSVPAGGVYAMCQSAAMGGSGASITGSATQAGAVAISAAVFLIWRKK